MYKKEERNGFSLIELLVVMFIIAILTGVLLPNLLGARQKAKDAQRISDADAMKNALRMYYNDTQSYPALGDLETALLENMQAVPDWVADPDVPFEYVSISPNDSFTIRFKLESASGNEDEVSQRKCGVAEESVEDGYYMVCAN